MASHGDDHEGLPARPNRPTFRCGCYRKLRFSHLAMHTSRHTWKKSLGEAFEVLPMATGRTYLASPTSTVLIYSLDQLGASFRWWKYKAPPVRSLSWRVRALRAISLACEQDSSSSGSSEWPSHHTRGSGTLERREKESSISMRKCPRRIPYLRVSLQAPPGASGDRDGYRGSFRLHDGFCRPVLSSV